MGKVIVKENFKRRRDAEILAKATTVTQKQLHIYNFIEELF
jgi:hypothetical protein